MSGIKEMVGVIRGLMEDGTPVMVMPITRLDCIEDSSETVTGADNGDYIPVIDTKDNGQMKKILVSDLHKEVFASHDIAVSLLLTLANRVSKEFDEVRTDVLSESGTVTLTNDAIYPFNNSQKTVPLVVQRTNANYTVVPEIVSCKGNVGEIVVSDILENGFKIAYTGSAASVTLKYKVIGGFTP
ncbi:MAG TPA: hypothetical protein DIV52_05900 [Ruminococcaceae bacterium]|nr:hypothetical protein [Oscillospiraceae bacterium]